MFCKILTLGNRCQQSSTTPGQQVCVCVLCLHLTPDTWGYCSRYDKGDMSSVSHLPEYYWSLPHYLCLGHDKEEPAYINSYCDRYNKRYICSVSHRSLPHHLFLSHNKEQSAITLDTYNPLSMPHAHPIHSPEVFGAMHINIYKV